MKENPPRQPQQNSGPRLAHWRRRFWTFLAITLAWFFVGSGTAQAQIDWPDNLTDPPSATDPTPVEMSLYLDDVNQIDVTTHSYKVTGQLVMEWHDERLESLFGPDTTEAFLEFEGGAVPKVLEILWHPAVEIMNEREQRHTGVRSLAIYPDGRVKLYEKFDSTAHLEGNMRFYPFVHVDLRLAFSAFEQSQAELILKTERYEFEYGESAEDVIVGPWSFISMQLDEDVIHRSDEPDVLYPRADFILTVQRDLFSGISIFLMPVLLIWICSFALLWLDAKSRVGGALTLLLTSVALQLTWESKLPSVHYLTLPNILSYMTILLLTLNICLTVTSFHLSQQQAQEGQSRFDRIARWAYPALAVVTMGFAVLILFVQTV